MGTRYSAVFYAPDDIDASAINAALFASADKVDRQMSTWKPDSDLSRLNAAPAREWFWVPEELMTVLDAALRVGVESGGAFDIGVGDLVDAWGFGPAGTTPDAVRASALKSRTQPPAFELLELDRVQTRVRKRSPIALDLSGIAKGYGVDALANCLDGFGITRYLVGIDGELRARGHKPDGRAWAVAIERPVRDVREAMGVMELADAAIATSGNYRQLGHTMDPVDRQPVRNRLASVTVVMPDCMLADAWATALLVLGETEGVALARKRGMTALFAVHAGNDFEQISIVDGERRD